MNPKTLTLGAALGLSVGCATTSPYISAGAEDDIARINALDIVQVGALIVDAPEGYGNCYGPCPGDEELLEEETLQQEARLAQLTEVAEAAAQAGAEGGEDACSPVNIEENLDALDALRIVEVEGLAASWPEGEANCYGYPCGDALDDYCERAGVLARIVDGSEGL